MSRRGKVVIAGGSGFLGGNLRRKLISEGYEVIVLSRKPLINPKNYSSVMWDGRSLGAWVNALEGAVAVVNLVGRSVDCIKTPDNCDEILRSRVEATKVLGQALGNVKNPPQVWVQMSTAHIYGDPSSDILCDEKTSFGYGFAPTIGKAWEETFRTNIPKDIRQVIVRPTFVLGRTGGALPRLAKIVKWGLGGRAGHGQQGISWIHEDDVSSFFLEAIECRSVEGVYVLTAPNPVSNLAFMKGLRKYLNRPIGLPAPEWVVRLFAPLIMRSDAEIVLYGRYCKSSRLCETDFKFPTLEAAFNDLFK